MNYKPQIAVTLLLLQSPMTIFVLKSPGFRRLSYSSEMQNYANAKWLNNLLQYYFTVRVFISYIESFPYNVIPW